MLMSAVLLKAKYMPYQNIIFVLYILILVLFCISNTIHFRFSILVMLVDNHSTTAINPKNVEDLFKHSTLKLASVALACLFIMP